MNVLSKEKRCAIIRTLVEGNSMRATARLVDLLVQHRIEITD
jgi:hypothetical protein